MKMYRYSEFLKALIETDRSVSMPGCHCGLNKAGYLKKCFGKNGVFFPAKNVEKI
jgi:hypothetical protein